MNSALSPSIKVVQREEELDTVRAAYLESSLPQPLVVLAFATFDRTSLALRSALELEIATNHVTAAMVSLDVDNDVVQDYAVDELNMTLVPAIDILNKGSVMMRLRGGNCTVVRVLDLLKQIQIDGVREGYSRTVTSAAGGCCPPKSENAGGTVTSAAGGCCPPKSENAGGTVTSAAGGCCPPKSEDAGGCCVSVDASLNGYSFEDIAKAGSANLGLGCGNPLSFANLQKGETVVDLGSGAGIDVFIGAADVGPTGRAIGVDMTPEMLTKARALKAEKGIQNAEFRLGEIENLPLADNSADCIISNCVINLSPDKSRVFEECFRVLKRGGRVCICDVVMREGKTLPDDLRTAQSLAC